MFYTQKKMDEKKERKRYKKKETFTVSSKIFR